ncbi:MAG: PilZ domain-containing protein [Xanthomonadales bacterium]|nr:PilZ domain-containing protein [Xanthomonadales bacterium]
MEFDGSGQYLRHARMSIRSIVLISMGPLSWITEVENISATGLLARRPEEWCAGAGERCVLDLLVGDDLHIHLEAIVARLTADCVGLAYTSIPADKEHALWGLLGHYADHLDRPGVSTEND